MKLFKLWYSYLAISTNMLIPSLNIPWTHSCMLQGCKNTAGFPIRKASSPRGLLLLSVSSKWLNPVHSSSHHLVAPKSLLSAVFLTDNSNKTDIWPQICEYINFKFNFILYVACMFTKFKPIMTHFYSNLTLVVFIITWELLWIMTFTVSNWDSTIDLSVPITLLLRCF